MVLTWRLLSSNEHAPVSFLTACLWSPWGIALFQSPPRAETQFIMYQCCLTMRPPLSVSQKLHPSSLGLVKAFPLSRKARSLSSRPAILILMCASCLAHMLWLQSHRPWPQPSMRHLNSSCAKQSVCSTQSCRMVSASGANSTWNLNHNVITFRTACTWNLVTMTLSFQKHSTLSVTLSVTWQISRFTLPALFSSDSISMRSKSTPGATCVSSWT